MGLVLIHTICELPESERDQVATALARAGTAELPLLHTAMLHGRVTGAWRRAMVRTRIREIHADLDAGREVACGT
jgi:hypothetical protein